MSSTHPLRFLDLPLEIRFMIYRLLFQPPSARPILIGLIPSSPVKHSAQLLRVCRACHAEGSPVLYGGNQFALDWAYAGTEVSILEFLETIGMRNRGLIRHLRARYLSISTLEKMRAKRSLRPVLEGLDSLSLELYNEKRPEHGFRPGRNDGAGFWYNLRRYLKVRRGPYQKLVRIFAVEMDCAVQAPFLSLRLVSAACNPGWKEWEFDLDAEIESWKKKA